MTERPKKSVFKIKVVIIFFPLLIFAGIKTGPEQPETEFTKNSTHTVHHKYLVL